MTKIGLLATTVAIVLLGLGLLLGFSSKTANDTIVFGGRINASQSGGYYAFVEFTPGPNGSLIDFFHGSSISGCGDLYFTISDTEYCTDPDVSGASPNIVPPRQFGNTAAKSSVKTCFTVTTTGPFPRPGVIDQDVNPMFIKGGSNQHGAGPLPLFIPRGKKFQMECFDASAVMLFTIQVRDL